MSLIPSPDKTPEKLLAEKWQKLQDQHHHLQRRQDKIDVLALDTLLKMEVLLAKLKTLPFDARKEGGTGQDQELREDSYQRQGNEIIADPIFKRTLFEKSNYCPKIQF